MAKDAREMLWRFTPGTRILDRFEIIERLGGGSAGAVCLAVDHELHGVKVALKVLHPWHGGEAALARFQSEMLVTRRLRHEHITKTYEFFSEENDIHLIVMEYIDGVPLVQLLEDYGGRSLPLYHALRILSEIADALAYAHGEGIIHRDVKPQNILLTKDGRVKVSDFGLARVLECPANLTRANESVGTPLYMSPEQFTGSDVGIYSDIYSLGILGYEALTGAHPFLEEVYLTLALRHLNDKIEWPPAADVPRPVRECIEMACAKHPAERYPAMNEFLADLKDCLRDIREIPWQHVEAQVRISRHVARFRAAIRFLVRGVVACTAVYIISLSLLSIASYCGSNWLRRFDQYIVAWFEYHTPNPLLMPAERIVRLRNFPSERPGLVFDMLNNALPQYSLRERADYAEFLVRAGADLSGQDMAGNRTLHMAVVNYPSVVKYLVSRGVDLNQKNADGKSALQIALLQGRGQSIIANLGASDLTLVDKQGDNTLHSAVRSESSSQLQAILVLRPSQEVFEQKNNAGETPLALAVQRPPSALGKLMLQYLLSAGAKVPPEQKLAVDRMLSFDITSERLP